MKAALWIIAICSLIRIVQNGIQLFSVFGEKAMRVHAYEEFVKSLKESDRAYVERLLREFEESEKENGDEG